MSFQRLYRFLRIILSHILFDGDVLVNSLEKMTADEIRRRAKRGESPALFSYKDPHIRAMVWNMKYKRNRIFFEHAALLLSEELTSLLEDERLFSYFENPLIIPVPLSYEKSKERGYNQVEEILNIMKSHLGSDFEVSFDCIRKIRHTENQTRLSKKERLQNLRGAFLVTYPEKVKGRTIIIIDDVLTTGATIAEITSVLKRAGARKVIPLVFAH